MLGNRNRKKKNRKYRKGDRERGIKKDNGKMGNGGNWRKTLLFRAEKSERARLFFPTTGENCPGVVPPDISLFTDDNAHALIPPRCLLLTPQVRFFSCALT